MAETAAPAPPPGRPTALVAGATGLIGSHLLRVLCNAPEFGRVVAVSRRPLAYDHPKLANRIMGFEDLEESAASLRAETAFCCLGTTLAAAGSREAFSRVDHDFVLAFARAAQRGGARRMVLISSVGADPASKNFYLRVKGETEADAAKVGFEALDIMQPSLLVGWRKELRPLEFAMMMILPLINPLLIGGAQRYRAVTAETVAAAMLGAVRVGRKGINRHTHRAIRDLAAVGARHPRGSAAAPA